jgi:hypothetical protein
MKLLKIMLCWIFIPYVMVWRYMKQKGFAEKQYILMSVIVAFIWFGLVFSHNSVDTEEDKEVYTSAIETNDIDYEEVYDTEEAETVSQQINDELTNAAYKEYEVASFIVDEILRDNEASVTNVNKTYHQETLTFNDHSKITLVGKYEDNNHIFVTSYIK